MRDMVLVLNLDNVSSRAVARKLRSEGFFCKILPGNSTLEEIQAQSPLGLILSGGENGQAPAGLDERLLHAHYPVLALGDAAALLLESMGGSMGERVLYGAISPITYLDHPLLAGLEASERLIRCGKEIQLSSDIRPICRAQEITLGFAHENLPLFGLQFQVEQNDMEGSMILRNFAMQICGCTAWWDDDAFVTRAVEEIRRVAGDGKAICAMTGGLDSGVSALLAFKALGHRLKCIFVDSGLLREKEGDEFMAFYRDALGMDVIRVDARERFLSALQGVSNPEEKKRIIGLTMQAVLSEERERLGDYQALIRGTSFSDIMFGERKPTPQLSKTVPVIEPIRELFKDEIRRIGGYLGMPQEIVTRQPFPGSGLALRILGEVTEERLNTLRAADAIFRSEIVRANQARRLWQYFAVLSPMPGEAEKSVIVLRAVQAGEGNQAHAARLPYDLTEAAVEAILHERPEVCRVVFDLTPGSNYAGVEWQ